jgi:hypothetical protein
MRRGLLLGLLLAFPAPLAAQESVATIPIPLTLKAQKALIPSLCDAAVQAEAAKFGPLCAVLEYRLLGTPDPDEKKDQPPNGDASRPGP